MKSKNYFLKIASAILLLFAVNSNANNVEITGTSVSGSNITFNISWENSWNANVAPANWDAVWVFVKYQDCNTRLWAHAGLSTVAGDHSAASPLQADPVADGRGVFLRRSALGGGNISSATITLKMTIPAGTYNYKVFGIEMVNVPQAAFEIGDGVSASTFNSITVNASSQSGGITAATIGGGGPTVPAAYPMGYNSFYCMKYEISQLQYVEFLNALTFAQQQTRITTDPTSATGTYVTFGSAAYRNGIVIETPGNNAAIPAVFGCDATNGVINNNNDGQSVAMNNLSWADVAAYLDWAALRPMTELEYEKVCRGTMPRVAGEFPWGDTNINAFYSTTVLNPLQPGEVANAAVNGRCAYGLGSGNAIYGPLRVGLFATASSGRSSAGAAYYGAMEMGGNVYERVVSAGNAAGVLFTGVLGDGTLTAIGDANQTNWPSPATALGAGFKGGDYVTQAPFIRISERSSATSTVATRGYSYGGRGVR
ncbi:MAG: SUMF1/EgtB/PvdO family nonheme iron enzyme [Flavobacterium sp. JAD_PAG50586_2]|nr:MAG: SUMF1/EgtB/PvdO family nonheme iron enzyme [Flavobacterium sp. JAD_PAG50586_2]